jgi:membrane-associated phospholipid phosphatase
MFQTSINHFFQGFAGTFSNWFMRFISDFGTYYVYLVIILIVMFGWNLRKGFFLVHIMFWAGMSNSFLKNYFNLPRPIDIDETLKVYEFDYNLINIDGSNHSPAGFFQSLPHDIVEKCRLIGLKSPGFPSGHAASAAAFWTTLPLMAKKTWLWFLGILIIILIMISRMYLGVHFLADVTGGLISGLVIVTIGFLIYYNLMEIDIKRQRRYYLYTFTGRLLKFLYYIGIPIAFTFIPQIGIQYTAPLMGINLVIITSDLGNIQERGHIWERIIRVIFAVFLFFALAKLLTLFVVPKNELLIFLLIAAHYFITLRLSISLCIWTRLYKRTY